MGFHRPPGRWPPRDNSVSIAAKHYAPVFLGFFENEQFFKQAYLWPHSADFVHLVLVLLLLPRPGQQEYFHQALGL